MIVVIQCAGSKVPTGKTFKTADGTPVHFVAHPEHLKDSSVVYARPDDDAGDGKTWRDKLIEYNKLNTDNPLGFVSAGDLYKPPIYQKLTKAIETQRLFILSAGWGLIRSDFLTPTYDITFSAQAAVTHRRREKDCFKDFSMLPAETEEPVLFFGGKSYLPMFLDLTAKITSPRVVYYQSAREPDVPGCIPVHFQTRLRTNWHYECAEHLLAGTLTIPRR